MLRSMRAIAQSDFIDLRLLYFCDVSGHIVPARHRAGVGPPRSATGAAAARSRRLNATARIRVMRGLELNQPRRHMKYFLLIITALASLGLTSANSASPKANGCCNGGACCTPSHGCCHKAVK
jgi:hypothetical protein